MNKTIGELGELIDIDWPDFPVIDENLVVKLQEEATTAREHLGKVWTDEDLKDFCKKVLNTPLP